MILNNRKIFLVTFSIFLFTLISWLLTTQTNANDFKYLEGKILLQVEENGEAWYVVPNQGKRVFLSRPDDAFSIMTNLGLGISNQNLFKLEKINFSKHHDEKNNDNKRNTNKEDIEIPDYNSDMEEIIPYFSDPQVLVKFLNENFSFKNHANFHAKNPESFYNKREGNVFDLVVFCNAVLKDYTVISSAIRYEYRDENNIEGSYAILVFRKDNETSYITLNNDKQVDIYNYSGSFRNLFKLEEQRQNINIYRYFYVSSSSLNLSQPKEPFSWQEL